MRAGRADGVRQRNRARGVRREAPERAPAERARPRVARTGISARSAPGQTAGVHRLSRTPARPATRRAPVADPEPDAGAEQ